MRARRIAVRVSGGAETGRPARGRARAAAAARRGRDFSHPSGTPGSDKASSPVGQIFLRDVIWGVPCAVGPEGSPCQGHEKPWTWSDGRSASDKGPKSEGHPGSRFQQGPPEPHPGEPKQRHGATRSQQLAGKKLHGEPGPRGPQIKDRPEEAKVAWGPHPYRPVVVRSRPGPRLLRRQPEG